MNVDEFINLCDSSYVILDTSIILDYTRLLKSRKSYEQKMEILSRIMNCNKKTISSLIYEEILAGASQNEDELKRKILYSFEIFNISVNEAEVASHLERELKDRGCKPKGENWRIDLFTAAFVYTQQCYILAKDRDFTKILNCEKLDEVEYYVCKRSEF
ncbi:type II toxin-antitoxin system VapC family toxin [Acidianus brierleyi]|uniref:PIN domain-containing protein n=1 Tax=Acidianus brierleyi TaxID=41673 RepID=A0A2U9ID40_9CREN|nr:PIN domain-containing protein [Acidianus brierleyi]AWR93943.1 PIN domain-containing protein [Acidianus brierleyi]